MNYNEILRGCDFIEGISSLLPFDVVFIVKAKEMENTCTDSTKMTLIGWKSVVIFSPLFLIMRTTTKSGELKCKSICTAKFCFILLHTMYL